MKNKPRKKTKDDRLCIATHEELCDAALSHYRKISREANYWSGCVEEAIKFFRQYGGEVPSILREWVKEANVGDDIELTIENKHFILRREK